MVLVNGVQTHLMQVSDRGLMYGDGVFRTLRVQAGYPLCWERHYRKLQADCAVLKIVCPAENLMRGELDQLIRAAENCIVKMIVTRGQSDRGYALPAVVYPNRVLVSTALTSYPDHFFSYGVKLQLCQTKLALQPLLAGIKHLNRLENVLARMEWSDPAIAEGLLCDMDGNVIEGTMSNLFMIKGHTLYTPELNRCGVAGVQRDRIIALAPELGLQVEAGNFDLAFLLEAEEVLLSNSLIGVWQVRQLADKTWEEGRMTHTFRLKLDDKNN